MNKQEISVWIQKNFIDKVSYVANKCKEMNMKKTDEFISVDCGMPADTFNISVLLKDTADYKHLLHETVDHFTIQNFPMSLWCWDNIGESTKQAIINHGLVLSEVNIGMYADTSELHPIAGMPDGFLIRQVSSPMEVRQFGDALSSLFGDSMEGTYVRKYYNKHSETSLYDNSDMKLYMGSFNDDVVCIGSAMYTQNSVGIYDIATLHEQRKRGLGSAMFNFILSEIKKSYDGLCVLQASEAGANIYQRAGFKPVCSISVFENRHMIAAR